MILSGQRQMHSSFRDSESNNNWARQADQTIYSNAECSLTDQPHGQIIEEQEHSIE